MYNSVIHEMQWTQNTIIKRTERGHIPVPWISLTHQN